MSCSRTVNTKVEISGVVVGGDTTGTVVLIQSGQSRSDAATSDIINRKFHLTADLKSPEEFSLMTETPNQRISAPINIFIAPGDKIDIIFESSNVQESIVKGSKTNDEYQHYLKTIARYYNEPLGKLWAEYTVAEETNDTLRMRDIDKEIRVIQQAHLKKDIDYIKANPDSYISACLLYKNRKKLNSYELKSLLTVLDKKLYSSKYIDKLVRADRNQIGMKASDFTLLDVDSKSVQFSEISKGKLTLLEFWASWCPSCLGDNPRLERLYQQYKAQGFLIVGVSQDPSVDVLRKSIEKDGISWINLLDVNGNDAVTELYNIELLPANILIDAAGTVIAKDISIDELQEQCEKLLPVTDVANP
jgi:peroxiredoxin